MAVDGDNGTAQANIPLVFGTGATPSIEINSATVGTPTVRVIGIGSNANTEHTPLAEAATAPTQTRSSSESGSSSSTESTAEGSTNNGLVYQYYYVI